MSKFILVGGPAVGALAFLTGAVFIFISDTPIFTKIWAGGLDLIFAIVFAYWAYTWAVNPPGAEAKGLGDREGQTLKQLSGVKKISGQIVDIKHLTNIRVNGQAPYIIFAKVIDSAEAGPVYSSAKIWSDPQFALNQHLNNNQTATIDIYIDPNNPKRYYLDLPMIGIDNQR